MSRYIDADALEDKAKQYSLGYYEEDEWAVPLKEITSAPSIDIVRCSECKYEPICSHSVQHTTHEQTSVTIGYKSVDFCSYGERKESE